MSRRCSPELLLIGYAMFAAGACTIAGLAASLAADPGLDLPVGHPHDHRPRAAPALPPEAPTLPASVVQALEEMPLPVPAPVPPAEDPQDEPLPVFFGEELSSESSSVVFVLDISGSMNQPMWDDVLGYGGPQKITVAKRELLKAIQALPRSWSFDVIAYDDCVYLWRPNLVDASDTHKTDAASWVTSRQPFGSTLTGPAVAAALALDRENHLVVLLTDGAPTGWSPDEHRKMIRDANHQRATVDVFGIEATGGMLTFCKGVATDNAGRYVDAR